MCTRKLEVGEDTQTIHSTGYTAGIILTELKVIESVAEYLLLPVSERIQLLNSVVASRDVGLLKFDGTVREKLLREQNYQIRLFNAIKNSD